MGDGFCPGVYLPRAGGTWQCVVVLMYNGGFISIQTQLKASTNDALAEAGSALIGEGVGGVGVGPCNSSQGYEMNGNLRGTIGGK